MSLRDDVEYIINRYSIPSSNMETLLTDEHARYQLYLTVMPSSDSSTEHDLMARIMRDPDQVMSEAAITHYIDDKASSISTSEQFITWSTGVRNLVKGHQFLVQRINEWILFKTLKDGRQVLSDELTGATDWLQRKIASELDSPHALEVMASFGRTKRVRNLARIRLRSV